MNKRELRVQIEALQIQLASMPDDVILDYHCNDKYFEITEDSHGDSLFVYHHDEKYGRTLIRRLDIDTDDLFEQSVIGLVDSTIHKHEIIR